MDVILNICLSQLQASLSHIIINSQIDGELYSVNISNACASQNYFIMGGSKELYQKKWNKILHTNAFIAIYFA